MVEAFADGLGRHISRRAFESNKDADGGVFSLDDAGEAADVL